MRAPTYFGVEPTPDGAAEPAPRPPAPNAPRPAAESDQGAPRPAEADAYLLALLRALSAWST